MKMPKPFLNLLCESAKLSPNELKALPAKAAVVAIDKPSLIRLTNLPIPASASEVAPVKRLNPICTAKIVPSKSLVGFSN